MTASSAGAAPKCRHHVYVIELEPIVTSDGKPALYVGETGQTPAVRFARHLAGGRTASKVVARHGVRLRPDLAAGWGPYASRAQAVAAEAALAEELRAVGYHVYGGQGVTFQLQRGQRI